LFGIAELGAQHAEFGSGAARIAGIAAIIKRNLKQSEASPQVDPRQNKPKA
jgi:hypothetical protein